MPPEVTTQRNPELAPEIPTKSPEDSDTLMHLSGYIFRAAIDEGLRRT
jgi:hypothetical protein